MDHVLSRVCKSVERNASFLSSLANASRTPLSGSTPKQWHPWVRIYKPYLFDCCRFFCLYVASILAQNEAKALLVRPCQKGILPGMDCSWTTRSNITSQGDNFNPKAIANLPRFHPDQFHMQLNANNRYFHIHWWSDSSHLVCVDSWVVAVGKVAAQSGQTPWRAWFHHHLPKAKLVFAICSAACLSNQSTLKAGPI